MGNQKVSTTRSFVLVAPVVLHKAMPPAAGDVHIETPTPGFYPPGIAAHKFAGTVFHQSYPVAQEGHDHGNYILHANCPPYPPTRCSRSSFPFPRER